MHERVQRYCISRCNLLEIFFFFTGHRIAFNYGSSEISELWLSSVHTSCQLSDAVWIPVLHQSLNVSQVMAYNH